MDRVSSRAVFSARGPISGCGRVNALQGWCALPHCPGTGPEAGPEVEAEIPGECPSQNPPENPWVEAGTETTIVCRVHFPGTPSHPLPWCLDVVRRQTPSKSLRQVSKQGPRMMTHLGKSPKGVSWCKKRDRERNREGDAEVWGQMERAEASGTSAPAPANLFPLSPKSAPCGGFASLSSASELGSAVFRASATVVTIVRGSLVIQLGSAPL